LSVSDTTALANLGSRSQKASDATASAPSCETPWVWWTFCHCEHAESLRTRDSYWWPSPWNRRPALAIARGFTRRLRLSWRFAASTAPLAEPVAYKGDRCDYERQGKQKRVIRCEVPEPFDQAHISPTSIGD